MFRTSHPHFVTGAFKPQNVFLDSHEYGLALDCLVKACTDLLILDSDGPDGRVMLGKRIVEPQPDWWFMGGRMKPGETPEESMSRLVARELHLKAGEISRIHMDESEYSEFRWFTLSEIVGGAQFHPALRASVRDLVARHAWNSLKDVVASDSSNECAIAEAARKLVALSPQ